MGTKILDDLCLRARTITEEAFNEKIVAVGLLDAVKDAVEMKNTAGLRRIGTTMVELGQKLLAFAESITPTSKES
jgi:hypothetical protein